MSGGFFLAEDNRIAQEIQKKQEKEGRNTELEEEKTMDGDAGNSRSYGDSIGSALNNTNANTEEEMELDFKRSSRAKNWGSSRSGGISLSIRCRQRSTSPRKCSRSPRRSRSPQRHSPRSTPSISRRRSTYSRRGSHSSPRYPSPGRRRLRSPSPGRRWPRSPSPGRRRPRSPSPGRRRPRSPSPGRRWPRSPSPGRRWPRSPSPGRRRPRSPSPGRRRPRSLSPGRRRWPRSPSPGRRRPRSPSPGRRRPWSLSPGRRRPRSPSPGRLRPWSRSPVRRRSPSPKRQRVQSPPKARHAVRLQRRRISPQSNKNLNISLTSLDRDKGKVTNSSSSNEDVAAKRDAKFDKSESTMLYLCELYDDGIDSIKKAEESTEMNIDQIRKAYDDFLSHFPFSLKYWICYAKMEMKYSDMDRAIQVFERAVLAVPSSVDIWCNYCQFAVSMYKEQSAIRSLFERALKFVGDNYFCASLYDTYLEYEDSQENWGNMASIYLRLLQTSIEDLDWYFNCFRHLTAIHGSENLENVVAAINETQYLQQYLSMCQKKYEGTKSINPNVLRDYKSVVPLLPYQPRSSYNMVTLPLLAFLQRGYHIKEITFVLGALGSRGVVTPIGTRLLTAIYRRVTEQHLCGFCWAGCLKPEDILITFDGTDNSELVCHITKPAVLLLKATDIVADHTGLKLMLTAPFTCNGFLVPYIEYFFLRVMCPPVGVESDVKLRERWIETIRMNPLFSSQSRRMRLYRYLHKLFNSDSACKSTFNVRFSSVPRMRLLVGFDSLWIQYHKHHEEFKAKLRAKQNPQAAVQANQYLEINQKFWTLTKIVGFIRQFDSHVMELFIGSGLLPSYLQEINHHIDCYFDFLLQEIVVELVELAPSDPRIRNVLQIYSNGS